MKIRGKNTRVLNKIREILLYEKNMKIRKNTNIRKKYENTGKKYVINLKIQEKYGKLLKVPENRKNTREGLRNTEKIKI